MGGVYAILAAGLVIGFLTYKVLANRDSKWRFSAEEMARFHIKEKMAKK